MYQRGGEHAETAAKHSSEVLLPLKEEDGSWKSTGGNEGNRVYRTAMAVLSLSVKYHYQPIYQRLSCTSLPPVSKASKSRLYLPSFGC